MARPSTSRETPQGTWRESLAREIRRLSALTADGAAAIAATVATKTPAATATGKSGAAGKTAGAALTEARTGRTGAAATAGGVPSTGKPVTPAAKAATANQVAGTGRDGAALTETGTGKADTKGSPAIRGQAGTKADAKGSAAVQGQAGTKADGATPAQARTPPAAAQATAQNPQDQAAGSTPARAAAERALAEAFGRNAAGADTSARTRGAAGARSGRAGTSGHDEAKASRGTPRAASSGFTAEQAGGQVTVVRGSSAAPTALAAGADVQVAAKPETGPGVTSAGQAATARGTAPTEVADQLAESIRAAGMSTSRHITISLRPPELGRVTITFRSEGDTLHGTVRVENPETVAKIEREILPLMQRLQASGVEIRRLDVQLSNGHDGGPMPQSAFREGPGSQGDWLGGEAAPAAESSVGSGEPDSGTRATGMGAGEGFVDVQI
ncbi:MAG: flagellar hook-length control protein FliK [Planctomycetes bacterium]|nr:flagellar hook-length control protein FliK [Planctomycetota bacterium]